MRSWSEPINSQRPIECFIEGIHQQLRSPSVTIPIIMKGAFYKHFFLRSIPLSIDLGSVSTIGPAPLAGGQDPEVRRDAFNHRREGQGEDISAIRALLFERLSAPPL